MGIYYYIHIRIKCTIIMIVEKNKIKNNGKVMKIFSSSIDYCHRDKTGTSVRGGERAILKKKIKDNSLLQFKKFLLLKTQHTKLITTIKILQDIKSENTFKRIMANTKSQ